MNTIALRFGEHFAPTCGTIEAHQNVIDSIGFVWYGKMGSRVSAVFLNELLKAEHPRILLINSGKADRYWAYISAFSEEIPEDGLYPSYYGEKVSNMKTWFKVEKLEKAPNDIMSKCTVISSGAPLGDVSKHSMSPYFKIKYEEVL